MRERSASPSLVIALDGPAASGKGTLAKKIAKRYGLAHLDTGLLYRAVGLKMLQAGRDLSDEAAAAAMSRTLNPALLFMPELRAPEVGKAASIVAAMSGVRQALLTFQRGFALHPPGGEPGAVLDGRDIGSVVCPDATVKFFVTATAQVRAHRRFLELKAEGRALNEKDILADIKERDARDMARREAPLVKAPGAHLLDTSDLSIEAAFAAACAIIDDQLGRGEARGS